MNNQKEYGVVTIVGFGPGNPEYLTIKGEKALNNADIIFYDALINKEYLTEFSCVKVFVGKRKGNHYKEQQEINELLYRAVITGKNVVRLKGGDPSIFGRLSEEVQFLREKAIKIEVIPGVTSASAAAAISGISLTQRGISKSIGICSGHNINDLKIPDAETLVFYMASYNFDKICKYLIKSGWNKNTPVIIISNASFSNQIIKVKTLDEYTKPEDIITPSIVIVGKIIEKEKVLDYLNQANN